MAARTSSARTTKAKRGRPVRVTKGVLEKSKRRIPGRLSQIRGPRSQRSFARELGVFQQNVNRYENGTTPHADFLITLALKENVSLDWLLLGRGKPYRRA
ncbi:MAG: helix-turn-helix domain-containing protein [Myxococcota bacterium]